MNQRLSLVLLVFGATLFAPGNPADGDAIVITYNAAHGAGDLNFSHFNQLMAAINKHPITGGAVTATLAGTNLEITASRAGVSGNPNSGVGLGGALVGLVVDIMPGTDKNV